MPEMIAQWEPEDDNIHFVHKGIDWFAGCHSIKIGPIIKRFKSVELRKSDCLRFVDPQFGAVFNERQVETMEKEITMLLTLELSQDERTDCENLQKLIELCEPEYRGLMYFRFCSDDHSQKHRVPY